MPAGRGWTIISRAVVETLQVTNTPNSYNCAADNLVLTAHINPSVPGNITFNLFTDNTHATSVGAAVIDGLGNATLTLSPGTVANGSYWIQAVYPGSGPYAPEHTAPGTSGVPITITNSIPTVCTITPNFSQPICAYSNASFTVTATGSGSNPTSGTFQVWINNDGTFFEAATTGGTLSGSDSTTITVTGTTDPAVTPSQWPILDGANTIYAVYSGDGSCYGGSQSANQDINIFTNTITLSTPTQNGGSPVNFCKADGGSDTWSITPTMSNGSATGIMAIVSDLTDPTPVGSTTGTFTSGTPVTINIAHSAWPLGISQFAFATFTPTNTTNCYNSGNSLDTTAFTVSNSSTQAPTVTLGVSTSSSGPFTSGPVSFISGDTIYYQATVTKGSDGGSTTSSVQFNSGTISGGPYPSAYPGTPVSFSDSGGSSTNVDFNISSSYYPFPVGIYPGGDTYYVQAVYNSNSCFGNANSNQVTIIIGQNPPH